MPELRHHEAAKQAGDDERLCREDHPPNAVAADQGGGKRRHQPKQQQPDRERARHLRRVPAEFFTEGDDKRARQSDRPAMQRLEKNVTAITTQP